MIFFFSAFEYFFVLFFNEHILLLCVWGGNVLLKVAKKETCTLCMITCEPSSTILLEGSLKAP